MEVTCPSQGVTSKAICSLLLRVAAWLTHLRWCLPGFLVESYYSPLPVTQDLVERCFETVQIPVSHHALMPQC